MSTGVRNPIFARLYARMSVQESEEQVGYRREMLDGLAGRVLEIGAGNGRNFGYYPSNVTEVVAIEPEPYMRARASEAAAAATIPVRILDALADALPTEDGSFDAAVASLVLCSVPDQAVALAELRRVLRAGGELHFYEHVHAEHQPLRGFLSIADRSGLWPRIAGGCHPARDTRSAIEAAGFEIQRCREFSFSFGALQPAIPHIIGIARRGAD